MHTHERTRLEASRKKGAMAIWRPSVGLLVVDNNSQKNTFLIGKSIFALACVRLNGILNNSCILLSSKQLILFNVITLITLPELFH